MGYYANPNGGAPNFWKSHSGGPKSKDYSVWGSILVSRYFGKLLYEL